MQNFGRIGITRPEKFPHVFRIYKQESFTNAKGGERYTEPELVGTNSMMLSIASPDEAERYKQMTVTVTHTVFHPGPPIAKKNWYFALLAKDGKTEIQFFRIKAVHDKGGMNIFTTYYCEERGDINGRNQDRS